MDRSISDAIISHFLDELSVTISEGSALSRELRRLIDNDMMRREDALVELFERLAAQSR